MSLALALLLPLTACAEAPLPHRRLQPGDCLRRVELDHLREALRRCDKVVQTFPRDPQPLNERFLLHSLLGDDSAACRDINAAVRLAQRRPAASLDPLLRHDLAQRQASCRD